MPSEYRSQYLYNNINQLVKSNEVFPICVPSYNRPTATLLKYVDSLPIWLFIRREQSDMYSEYFGRCKVILLDEVHDIGTTRRAIVDYMWKLGYDNIFMLDDDIYLLSFRYPGFSKSGKELMKLNCNEKGETEWNVTLETFKMWIWMIRHSSPKVAISGVGRLFDWWNIRYKDIEFNYNSSSPIQCVHLNLKCLKDNNINYESNDVEGAEDYALQYKVMREGLYSVIYKDLAYDSARVNQNSGGNHTADICSRYNTYIQSFMNNLVEPEDVDKVSTKVAKSGIPSIRFNWNKWRVKGESMTYTVDTIDKDLNEVSG